MFVDDEFVMLGSANINQCSLEGTQDTEIAMGAYQQIHMSLWAEHIGQLESTFDKPESLECMNRMRRKRRGQHINVGKLHGQTHYPISNASSSASTPPASLQIVPALPGLPRLPAVLVLSGQEIPLGRLYHTHPNGCHRMLTTKKRVHPFPARIPANRRRFRYVSSSSSSPPSPPADHSLIALSLIRANLLPPRKRLRGSPSTFHQETSIEDSTERGYEASMEGSTKICLETDIEAGAEVGTEVGTDASVGAIIEIDVDVVAEPDTLLVLPEPTIAERLDNHGEEVEEEIRTLTSRLETAQAERTALRNRVRSLELSESSLRDTLRIERERFAEVQRHLGYVSEELRQSMMSHFADRESLTRIETFMIMHFGYRP
ncbi:reverse transcriptase domain-containing protein [Tanacetum coccineum]|uniref:phospholipase D n=1 Tax=Tanacetum coccineum TaxID=301880 RepID=A0ABQ5FDM8_9ASTR